MNCLTELRQFKKPQQNKFLTEPLLIIDASIHYEVHYLPNNLYMNLKSYWETIFFPHHDVDDHQHIIFTTLFSRTLIPQSYFDSILDSIFSKIKSVTFDSCYSGFNSIPLSMSIRVICNQEYNVEAQFTWERMLLSNVSIQSANQLPATEKSVGELETVVYKGEEDTGLECPICLKEFDVGDEITIMPCFHGYHRDCIVKWLKNSHLCPTCRFPLPVYRVVEGTFLFFKWKHYRTRPPATVGGTMRKKLVCLLGTRFIEFIIHLIDLSN